MEVHGYILDFMRFDPGLFFFGDVMSDPRTPFLLLNPDEVVVLSQTHVDSNAQKRMHKTVLSVTVNGCRTAGKSQIWFGYTCGSGGRLNFIIILEVWICA